MLVRLVSRRCSPRRLLLLALLGCIIYALTVTLAYVSHKSSTASQTYNAYSQIDIDPQEQRLYRIMNPGNVLIHDKYMQMQREQRRHAAVNTEQDRQEKPVTGTPSVVPSPTPSPQSSEQLNFPEPNYNLHAFYYPWYGNPQFDGTYLHWNHDYLPHWNKYESRRWPKGRHNPPDDIGSNFYPELGAYSSRDPQVIHSHMQQLRSAGIGTIAVSWYPQHQADEQGKPWDDLMPLLLDITHKYKIKVCFHIEPFKNRSEKTIRSAVMYIHDHYGSHPSYYQMDFRGKVLPVFYVYDSYLIRPDHWARLLAPDGDLTVRNSLYDATFIGLLVEERHQADLIHAGFDGFYTYFASDGFTFGSSSLHWGNLANAARVKDLLFVPSVGPGYVDTQIRPWNGHNTRHREHGSYYEQSFRAAQASKASIISITSFNEWGEGTQIEKAIPKQTAKFVYLDYAPQQSDYYLAITRKWALKLRKATTKITL